MIRKPKKPTSTLLRRYFLGLFAFFTGTLLCRSLSLSFFVLCLLLCLVLGVWVVRKHGKAKGFSGFLIFIGFVNILWVSGFVNFFSLFAFLENK